MERERNRVAALFNVQYPIVAGGMAWCSGWRLASAVSEAGGLGLIGASSMHADLLREHIRKCKVATSRPFGVNISLASPYAEEAVHVVAEEGVKIVFTSSGSPAKWTSWLHAAGITVAHVVSSTRFALKCADAGVDAVVAEGFEAGGHNGREETTTFCLVPAVRAAIDLPLLAAGGIGTASGVRAALALGAEGVQVGTRFALTAESSACDAFKDRCRGLEEGGTKLLLKALSPTRLIANGFRTAVEAAEARGASIDELTTLLGKGRARRGMFEGDMEEGELEIGQVATLIRRNETAAEALRALAQGFDATL